MAKLCPAGKAAAKKKPELAKKFGYNPKRIVAKKGGNVR